MSKKTGMFKEKNQIIEISINGVTCCYIIVTNEKEKKKLDLGS
jgi:hypothetical protein